jgi:hypothetical protein
VVEPAGLAPEAKPFNAAKSELKSVGGADWVGVEELPFNAAKRVSKLEVAEEVELEPVGLV